MGRDSTRSHTAMKILWTEKAVVLPGCLAMWDLPNDAGDTGGGPGKPVDPGPCGNYKGAHLEVRIDLIGFNQHADVSNKMDQSLKEANAIWSRCCLEFIETGAEIVSQSVSNTLTNSQGIVDDRE